MQSGMQGVIRLSYDVLVLTSISCTATVTILSTFIHLRKRNSLIVFTQWIMAVTQVITWVLDAR